MNIASLAVESTFVGIESTFVGHRKYLRFFTHLFTYVAHLETNVADTWKNLSFHVMLDSDVDGVAGSEAIGVDREIVLVITDALSLGRSVLIYQVALDGVRLFNGYYPLGFRLWKDTLIDNKCKSHERVDTSHSEP